MYKQALLYLACIITGFGMAYLPTSAIINNGIASFFEVLGGITIILFSLALLHLGIKSLLGK